MSAATVSRPSAAKLIMEMRNPADVHARIWSSIKSAMEEEKLRTFEQLAERAELPDATVLYAIEQKQAFLDENLALTLLGAFPSLSLDNILRLRELTPQDGKVWLEYMMQNNNRVIAADTGDVPSSHPRPPVNQDLELALFIQLQALQEFDTLSH